MDRDALVNKIAKSMAVEEVKVREYLNEADMKLPFELAQLRYCLEAVKREKCFDPKIPIPVGLAKLMVPLSCLMFYSDIGQKLGLGKESTGDVRDMVLVTAIRVAYEYGLRQAMEHVSVAQEVLIHQEHVGEEIKVKVEANDNQVG